MIAAIVAMSEGNVIGINNDLPWHLPQELKYFKQITTGHTIIMGRKTYESIGRPLPNRKNVVVTRQSDYEAKGVTVINNLQEYLNEHKEEVLFVIGGAELFNMAFPYFDTLYITEIHHQFEGDTFFPEFNRNDWIIKSRSEEQIDEKSKIKFTYFVYEKLLTS
ncbi:dihydrofolate reductase [Bacillus sp. JJ664]